MTQLTPAMGYETARTLRPANFGQMAMGAYADVARIVGMKSVNPKAPTPKR